MQKIVKKTEIPAGDFMILSAEGARGILPPTSRFSRFPLRGDLGKSEPVREHRQCLLLLQRESFWF